MREHNANFNFKILCLSFYLTQLMHSFFIILAFICI